MIVKRHATKNVDRYTPEIIPPAQTYNCADRYVRCGLIESSGRDRLEVLTSGQNRTDWRVLFDTRQAHIESLMFCREASMIDA